MATGINRAESYYRNQAGTAAKSFYLWRDKPCVFISHQQSDTGACEPIAEYLVGLGVDIYFDKYDPSIAALTSSGNPDHITQHIKQGIKFSTHMIGVVSSKTVKSYWVPFEIGYAYDQIPLGILTLADVTDEMLPEYMKTTNIIRGTLSLDNFVAELLSESLQTVRSRGVTKSLTGQHPLARILNPNR